MYRSGIQLPKVSFSQIDISYIPTNSYFIGFDLDNIGKLSKLDKNGTITVIEGGGSNLDIKSESITIATGVSVINFINAVTPPVVSGNEVTVDISGATAGIDLADLSADLPLIYNNLTGEFSINIASSSELGVVKIGSGLSIAPDGTLSSSGGSVTSVGLQVGSLGSDITVLNSPIVGSGSITLNIPSAGATARGVLTSDDWTKFNNKVPATRSISTTSPLQGGGTLEADRTLSIQQATTLNSGYLSSSDWNTFNNKQNALTGGITNQLTKWTSSSALGNSIVTESSSLLGVGITSPTAKLHINNLTASNSFLVEDTTNVDVSPFVIDGSGNVGAGVLIPTAKLHINNVSASNSFLVEDVSSVDASPFVIDSLGNVGVGVLIPTAKLHVTSLLAGLDLLLVEDTSSDTSPFVIKDSGHIGIGIITPTAKVHINSTLTGLDSFLVEDTTNIDTSPFVIKDNGNVGIGILTPTAKLHINTVEAGLDPFLVEDSTNIDSSPFVIDSFGKVGIGTITPTAKLEVLQTGQPWDEVAKFGFSTIPTSYLSLRSGKTATDKFLPEVRGYQNTATSDQALGIVGVIDSTQDNHPASTTGFLYDTGEPVVLFKAGKGAFLDTADHITDRRIFEFRNMNYPILSMDPTGGVKVYRGVQQVGQTFSGAAYTQFVHINGDGGGNSIASYSFPDNTKSLIIQSTTDESHTLATNTESELFPGIVFKIYDDPAAIINRDGNVGIGTSKNFVNVAARLHVTNATRPAEGGVETPGTPGEAFRMYEGYNTVDTVMISAGGFGQATWGKVTKDHTTGITQTLQVSKNGGGYYNVYIQNGLITNVLTFP